MQRQSRYCLHVPAGLTAVPLAHGHWCTFTDLYHTTPHHTTPHHTYHTIPYKHAWHICMTEARCYHNFVCRYAMELHMHARDAGGPTRCRGRSPQMVELLTSAPSARSLLTTASCPACAARCSGLCCHGSSEHGNKGGEEGGYMNGKQFGVSNVAPRYVTFRPEKRLPSHEHRATAGADL